MTPGAPSAAERAPKVAITGAGGFVGKHLVQALTAAQPDWALICPEGRSVAGGLDVTDPTAMDAWVRREQPDMVVHLAAVAAVTSSVKDPRYAWKVNLDGTLNLVLSLQTHAPDAHLLYVSSAEVDGKSLFDGAPAAEGALLQPVNPYAASKAAADILVRQAAAAGLSASVARPFNHTGPGQTDAFVVPAFARQIARIEAGLQPPVIEVGSLDEERDFLNVADVVDAYVMLLQQRQAVRAGEVFNVASGVPVRIGDLLDRLLSRARVRVEVRVDPSRLRATPIPRVAGDASRLRARGWTPRHALDEALDGVLQEQRALTAVR